jgi:cobalamin biosynthesis protein CobD/CbiB
MPPDGYTTITISEETASKLAEIVVENDLESVADAVDYATDVARDPETLSDAELARLLYRRLTD